MSKRILYVLALSVALVADAGAQRYVYPAKEPSAQQQASAQQQQAPFGKARAVCLEGRGDSVK